MLSRPPLLFDHNDGHYAALMKGQQNTNNIKDTHKSSWFLSTELTLVVKHEAGGPWTHDTVVGHGSEDQMENCTKL